MRALIVIMILTAAYMALDKKRAEKEISATSTSQILTVDCEQYVDKYNDWQNDESKEPQFPARCIAFFEGGKL